MTVAEARVAEARVVAMVAVATEGAATEGERVVEETAAGARVEVGKAVGKVVATEAGTVAD